MMDLLEKTPDFLIGTVLAGGLWLGFNYAVLAPRAMEHALSRDVVPACEQALQAEEDRTAGLLAPMRQLGGAPIFGDLMRALPQGLGLPRGARQAICACGAQRASAAARFDYAVYTATFRLVEPDTVSGLRGEAMDFVRDQACGALPWARL